MRVSLISHGTIRLPTGDLPLDAISIGLWTYEAAVRLARRGHEVSVFCEDAHRRFGTRREEHRGVTFHHVGTGFDAEVRRFGPRLRRQRDPTRPLFVSTARLWSYGRGVAAEIARRGADIAYVSNFLQLVSAVKRRNPATALGLHMQCEWLSQLDADLVRSHVRHCAMVSGCSRFVIDRVVTRFPELADRAFALHNGVDTEVFAPCAETVEPASREILFVGRRSPEKGVHVLLQAFASIAERVPDVRLRLIGPDGVAPYDFIAALDPDPLIRRLAHYFRDGGYREYLDSLIDPGLRPRVSFEDHVPQARLREAYRHAAVFVFPSVWNEPFGMPIIEAMGVGTPVVSTVSGGIPEFVDPDETGLLAARGDADDLAKKLLRVLEDRELAARLAGNARRQVLDAFSWDAITDRFEAELVTRIDDSRSSRAVATGTSRTE